MHQLLAYANDVNLLANDIDTKKNAETLTDASREVALNINTEKLSICCCVVTITQVRIMTMIENRYFENVAHLKF
jgi:hypothetical protein